MRLTKITILKQVLGSYYESSGEVLFRCPKCDSQKKKFSFNLEKGVYKCWLCDFSGRNIYKLLRRFGALQSASRWLDLDSSCDLSTDESRLFFEKDDEIKANQKIELPEDFCTLTKSNTPIPLRRAKKYLFRRGLTKEDILLWKIGFCSKGRYANRVVIPSFNLSGKLNYYVARSIEDGKYNKYKNPKITNNIIFNELLLNWSKPITLVEGVFDAIKAQNAVPLLGSTLRERSPLFEMIASNKSEVFLALDRDAEDKSHKISRLLLKNDIKVYKINMGNYEDVGEMSHKYFDLQKDQAKLVQKDDYLIHKLLQI